MKFLISARLWGLWLMSVMVVGWLFYTDPDGGASTRDMLQGALTGGLAATFAYLVRKTLLDYINLKEYCRAALEQRNVAAALIALGVMIFMSALLFVFSPRVHAQDVRTYVPAGAKVYGPVLKAEQVRLWPAHPMPSMLGALVEQESCITLKHPRCWNPAARLKTDREEGAGMGQITRAYNSDGSVRFDSLAAARQLDPSLAEWSWVNVYRRPDLQLRAIVAMNRDCYRRIARLVKDDGARLQMCDAAYNGGWGGLQAERRACGQRSGCDPQVWFGHVELACLKSRTRWKGYGMSACDINREHVRMVVLERRQKYVPLLESV